MRWTTLLLLSLFVLAPETFNKTLGETGLAAEYGNVQLVAKV